MWDRWDGTGERDLSFAGVGASVLAGLTCTVRFVGTIAFGLVDGCSIKSDMTGAGSGTAGGGGWGVKCKVAFNVTGRLTCMMMRGWKAEVEVYENCCSSGRKEHESMDLMTELE
jgi:hypothetical protein